MKKISVILVVLLFVVVACNAVMAKDFLPTDPGYNQGSVPGAMANKVQDVWATVKIIIRLLAVGCVIFAGLRYMFAAGDQKADIKQGLVYLTIGAVLVFGATLIIDLVKGTAESVLK